MNATGPWVKNFFDDGLKLKSPYGIRLIKGSHIVVPRVHDQPQSYILQNEDHRIVFVIRGMTSSPSSAPPTWSTKAIRRT